MAGSLCVCRWPVTIDHKPNTKKVHMRIHLHCARTARIVGEGWRLVFGLLAHCGHWTGPGKRPLSSDRVKEKEWKKKKGTDRGGTVSSRARLGMSPSGDAWSGISCSRVVGRGRTWDWPSLHKAGVIAIVIGKSWKCPHRLKEGWVWALLSSWKLGWIYKKGRTSQC